MPILNFGTIRPAPIAEWLNSYVSLPIFSYSGIPWKGASEIVTQFNYTATKNFTLRELPTPPVGVNFCLVIRYRIGLTSFRYKLWSNVNEVLNEPLYNGEVIKKNFVLEIWTVSNSTSVSLTTAINIKTSIRKIPDTYALLDEYADNDVVEEAAIQAISATSGTAPTSGLLAHYKPDGFTPPGGDGATITGWTDVITGGAANFSLNSHLNTRVSPALNGYDGMRQNGTGILQCTPAVAVPEVSIYLVAKQNSWLLDNKIISYLNPGPTEDYSLRQGITAGDSPGIAAFMQSSNSPANKLLPIGNFDIIKVTFNVTTDIAKVSILGNDEKSTGVVAGTTQATTLRVGPADLTLVEMLIYTDTLSFADETEVYKYLLGKFGLGIAIPMTVNDANPWLSN